MSSVVPQDPYNQYTGNGVATVYPYEFQLLSAGDLVVTVNGVVIPSSDFVLTGVGVQAGGDITFTVPPVNGSDILLSRVIALQRDTDYQYNGALKSDTVDNDFNRLWQALQGIGAITGGAVRAPFPEQIPALPNAAARANTLLAFDASGNPTVSVPVSGSAADVLIQLANSADLTKGDALVAVRHNAPSAIALNLHDWIEDDGSWNVMGWIPQNLKAAIRDRTSASDVDTYVNLAMTDLKSVRGAGTLRLPPGRFNLAAGIIGQQGIGLVGAGMQATLIYNRGNSTVHAIVYGTGTSGADADFEKVLLQGFSIIGSETSGRCFWGRKATTGFVIRDVYSEKGQNPWTLDSCYSLMMENVQVRDATVGHNIALNAITHDATLVQVASQIARAGAGLYTTGCYTVRMIGGKLEFNQRDQALVDSGRGISFRDVYVEGIQPTATGYAGIQVVAADVVNITGGLFDATQSGPMGTNGTGTYVKVSGASSRVRVRDYGFVSVAATQTHVNFGASAANCEAVVPLGSTYVNSSASCRVYNDDHDERGVAVYNSAVQAYTFGVWNGLTIDTEIYDPKSEWTTNQFIPKDYGVYSWDVIAGVQALATLRGAYFRLFNVTDGVSMAKVQYTNTGAGATTQVLSVHFKEMLTAGKAYQVQLFLDDTVNRNSVAGLETARQTIKRIA